MFHQVIFKNGVGMAEDFLTHTVYLPYMPYTGLLTRNCSIEVAQCVNISTFGTIQTHQQSQTVI